MSTVPASDHHHDQQEVQEWRVAFDAFDTDNDGTVSIKELGTVMRSLGLPATEAAIRDICTEYDQDTSGTLDFMEFVQLMRKKTAPSERMTFADGSVELYREAFRAFDINGDHTISKMELKHVMTNVGESLTDAELELMVCKADATGTQEITEDEFITMMQLCDPNWDDPPPAVELTTSQMAERCRKVEELLDAFNNQHADGNSARVNASQATIRATLRMKNGHAGRTFANLVGGAFDGMATDVTANSRGAVLPEYMMQKMEDLGAVDEFGANELAEIREKFRILDANQDGKLTYHEFKILQGFADTQSSWKVESDLRNDFDRIDHDGSGEISFEEFEKWWRHKMRNDEDYSKQLRNIGRMSGYAKLRIKKKERTRNDPAAQELKATSATMKFIGSKLSSGKHYWLDITGCRLALSKTEDDPYEKGRLMLSDPEVYNVAYINTAGEEIDGANVQTEKNLAGFKLDIQYDTSGGTCVAAEVFCELFDRPYNAEEKHVVAAERQGFESTKFASSDISTGAPDKDAIFRHVSGGTLQQWVNLVQLGIAFGKRHRSGLELWKKLRSRLRLVVHMQQQWGDLHHIYGDGVSVGEELAVPPWIKHPNSRFSMTWDMMQIVLLMGVSWNVPIRTCFGTEVPLWSGAFWFDAFTDVYFIIDVGVNFRAAYYDEKGVLVSDAKQIAKQYLKGWFPIDFASCLPVGYVQYIFAEGGSGGQQLRSLKALRLLRMGKMMRLAKITRMLQKYEQFAELKPFLAVVTVIALVFLAAHLLACFWFLLGQEDQQVVSNSGVEVPGAVIYGWVNTKFVGDGTIDEPAGDLWWGAGGANATQNTKYVTSMYGIFNALENGFTDTEKAFAIFSELVVGSLIYGGLAATLTAGLTEKNAAEQEFNTKYKALRTWMTSREVNRSQQKKVLKYYAHKFKDNTVFDEQELLEDLPPTMASHLMYTLYGKLVRNLPYFRDLDEAVLVRLAGACRPMSASKNTEIIQEGQIGNEMYILVEGEVLVEKGGVELGYLNKPGAFFGEVPVLDPKGEKTPRSRTIRAITDCFLVFLTRGDVQDLAAKYAELKIRLRRFARLGEKRRHKNSGTIVDGKENSQREAQFASGKLEQQIQEQGKQIQQMLRMLQHQSVQIEKLSLGGGTGAGPPVAGLSSPRAPSTPPRARNDSRNPQPGDNSNSGIAAAATKRVSPIRSGTPRATVVATSASARGRLQLAGRSVAMARPVSQMLSLNLSGHDDGTSGSGKPHP